MRQFLLQEGLVEVAQGAGGIGGIGKRLDMIFGLAGLVVQLRSLFPGHECFLHRPLLRGRVSPLHELVGRRRGFRPERTHTGEQEYDA